MLSDYLNQYKEAVDKEDLKRMTQIEKDLKTLGMDYYTLQVLLRDMYMREGVKIRKEKGKWVKEKLSKC